MNKTKPRLLDKVLELLRERRETMSIAEIAKAAGVSQGQLYHVLAGYTKNPGVNDMQKLYEYLTGRELEVI